jgi:hypothetical protein
MPESTRWSGQGHSSSNVTRQPGKTRSVTDQPPSRRLRRVRPRRIPLSPSVAVRDEVSWLFTHAEQSVRLTRVVLDNDTCHLLIDGPTDAQELRSFPDLASCLVGQSDIEERLLAMGFQLEDRTSERRGR